MIERYWHGAVPVSYAEDFRAHLERTGIAHANSVEGCLGTYVHCEKQGEYEHFFMDSYWRDKQAVMAFAGDRPQIAVTYPEDEKFQLISDPIVMHHDVQTVPESFPLGLV